MTDVHTSCASFLLPTNVYALHAECNPESIGGCQQSLEGQETGCQKGGSCAVGICLQVSSVAGFWPGMQQFL